MTRPNRSSCRPTLAILALLGLLAILPGGAGAHAELERSDPPAEGLLVAPPRTIELWFTERVAGDAGSPTVRVLDEAGHDLTVSDVAVDPADPRHVTARVSGLAPGIATVVWSARSLDDGHTLTGTFAFRSGAGRAPGAATTEGERPPGWAVATRWLTFLGLALAAAGFAFSLVIARGADEPPVFAARRLPIALGGAAVAALATLAEPLLGWRWPPVGTISPSLGDVIAGLPAAWWLRPAGAILAIAVGAVALLGLRRGRPVPAALLAIGAACGLAGLLGLSLTSHAAARETWRVPATAANVVHQWSIALWVGGLAHLAAWWRLGRDEAATDAPVRRFSRAALGLVAVGVVTGVVNAGLVLPAVRALWESDYGVVLLAKVALLAMPLALAALNRRWLARLAGEVSALDRVRRVVRWEVAAVALVVLGGSVLALLAPPATEADAPAIADVPMPAFAAYDGQDLLVHLRFTPGRTGENTFRVGLERFDRTPFTGEAPALVRLGFSSLAVGGGTTVDATPEADGTWTARSGGLGLAGWWEVAVTLRWLGRPDVTVPFYLLLPDPNLNGLDAPSDDPPGDPAAAEAYAAAMASYTGVHTVRYGQAMASHTGTVSYGVHVVNDGSDGSQPGFTFDIPGGWRYVVLGTTSWSQRPGEAWERGETYPMIPPADWDEEYTGARGFQLGREETIDGERCRVLTFVVPGEETRVVAWYAWWVGVESGHVRQEMMISQSHYMLSRFSDFDAPVTIAPPAAAEVATPVP